jgi:DNA-binding response OmpR family regulator
MSGTVLILDDSLTVRMDLAGAFDAAGLRPVPCATAAEARELLAREPVQVIILDVVLPDADGVDFLREVRANPSTSTAAVLMLSTEAEIKDRILGLQTGADEYVGKPYDTGYVVARAQELVRVRTSSETEVTKVLLIDDSPTIREELRRAFEENGYQVLTASNGKEGLRIAAAQRPDGVVVDGSLPDMDGATVIRSCRLDAALRAVPCVLLTGSEDRGAELRALDAGADASVRKEEDVAVILAKLSALLRSVTPGVPTGDATSILGPKRILAVDDSVTFLHALAESLRGEGYDVVPARSGEEALELLAVQTVDCVLLDLLMPGLSGQETCRRIKSAPVVRDVPLIMLTALEDRQAMIEALAAGADDYIPKSSEFEVLTARIRAQMRRKQLEDENRRIREELLHRQIEATEARAAIDLAETRAALVSELARKNQELQRANRELADTDQLKADLMAMLSHEINQPLAAITGHTDLLTAGWPQLDNHQRLAHLHHIGDAASGLAQLVADLLLMFRIDARALTAARAPVGLADAINHAFAALGRPADMRAHAPPELAVLADPGQLRQILVNLLGNAAKYGIPPIEIRAHRDGGRVHLTVRDHGPGVPDEFVPHLFDRFTRAATPSAAATPGTGLGLFIVRQLAQANGGTIGYQPAHPSGACFTVQLDLAAHPTPPFPHNDTAAAPRSPRYPADEPPTGYA